MAFKYYRIKEEYLVKIFNKEDLEKNKYFKRSFVGDEENIMLLVIPQQTNHNPHKHSNKHNYEYVYKDKQHFISISSMIYVPLSMRIERLTINELPEAKKKLSELNENKEIIESKIQKILKLTKHNTKLQKMY
jgi:hypothetical protein